MAPHVHSDTEKDKEGFEPLLNEYYDGKHLSEPIKEIKDKWKLLPAFLQVKGLVKQHIDSFNYFVNVDLRKLLKPMKKLPQTYTGIRVGSPERTDADVANRSYTPHECRLRDSTYSANIFVDVEYTRGKQIVKRRNVNIGRMPIMLRFLIVFLVGKTKLS
ncbi:unnamed protein product [Cunninghamella echinulata]